MSRTSRLLAAGALALGVAAVAPTSAAADGGTAKVTRSQEADPARYPAQVGILSPGVADNFQAQFCGGTHLAAEWVLTAAHCVEGRPTPDVLLGTGVLDDGSGLRVTGAAAVIHPAYAFPSNDIALIRLSSPVSTPVAPLAYPGMDPLEQPGTAAYVSGWGGLNAEDRPPQLFPARLQDALVPVVADGDCVTVLEAYSDSPAIAALQANPALIVCAGAGTIGSSPEEADACRGDSGGPLWAVGPTGALRQIGIVSGGPTCGYSPTYYTSVLAQIPWMEQTIGRQLASFGDIPGDTHEVNIERVALAGITTGTSGGLYEPASQVSRAQMATFIARAIGLAPVATGPFSDVAGNPHEGNINAVAAAGIATGTTPTTFSPFALVTRAQMATFIARALGLPPVDSGPFTDLDSPAAQVHVGNINAVAAAAIASGTSPSTFSPLNPVTRGQMASFLARGFIAPPAA